MGLQRITQQFPFKIIFQHQIKSPEMAYFVSSYDSAYNSVLLEKNM